MVALGVCLGVVWWGVRWVVLRVGWGVSFAGVSFVMGASVGRDDTPVV